MKLNIQLFGGRGAKSSSNTSKMPEVKQINYSERIDYIPDWFLDKNLTQNERYAISTARSTNIASETEKAIRVEWNTEYGTIRRWVPKSLLSDERIRESAIKQVKEATNFFRGMNYNAKLVDYAKKNKIKGVRTGMKTQTIISKIKDAGFEVPSRD